MLRGHLLSTYVNFLGKKKELQFIFLEKKEIIITSKHDTTIFLAITIFF